VGHGWCECREPTNGAEVVAARLEQVGRRQFVPPAFNPLARMKDTVVFGYLMASSKNGRVDVPDWCVSVNSRPSSSCVLVWVIATTMLLLLWLNMSMHGDRASASMMQHECAWWRRYLVCQW
jgi:hypothetical protein